MAEQIQISYPDPINKNSFFLYFSRDWNWESFNGDELKLLLYIAFNTKRKQKRCLTYDLMAKVISRKKIMGALQTLKESETIVPDSELGWKYDFQDSKSYFQIPAVAFLYSYKLNIRRNAFLVYFYLLKRLYNSRNNRLSYRGNRDIFGQKVILKKPKTLYWDLKKHMSYRTYMRKLEKLHSIGLLKVWNNNGKKQIALINVSESKPKAKKCSTPSENNRKAELIRLAKQGKVYSYKKCIGTEKSIKDHFKLNDEDWNKKLAMSIQPVKEAMINEGMYEKLL
ncbi:hypothetical protein SAMN04488598_14311 [Halanaerobium congolense]|uniref:Uncharacterized protein n=1 Tax=Halanaerobium congolense TaxID=54121 RepID=A0A1I0CEZ2_9FIRM|nr:hypothetical protein [Halanaerobium congolense]PTX14799.1 hypothetical protein C7953_2861 [Halanaerobium congolense]SDG06994.1 hypothetical protein SAMN04488598_14311 [Halanaerobium congolense]SET17961.1 hypothetical protein SAMN04515652_13516 [Halanaerobium congolense]SFP67975.1 hypothetical protein SAMN04488596_13916 [Halanaerobium congolense]